MHDWKKLSHGHEQCRICGEMLLESGLNDDSNCRGKIEEIIAEREHHTASYLYAEDRRIVKEWWDKIPGSHYPLKFDQLVTIMSPIAHLIRKAKL